MDNSGGYGEERGMTGKCLAFRFDFSLETGMISHLKQVRFLTRKHSTTIENKRKHPKIAKNTTLGDQRKHLKITDQIQRRGKGAEIHKEIWRKYGDEIQKRKKKGGGREKGERDGALQVADLRQGNFLLLLFLFLFFTTYHLDSLD